MELSPTAYVILGMLAWRPMSGYEIKALVDKSTRFFWAASYGQIYPELRRLAEAGLIEGKASPQGGRQRNVYRLTRAGQRELEAWLGVDAGGFETRDEGLLKLFFAEARPRSRRSTRSVVSTSGRSRASRRSRRPESRRDSHFTYCGTGSSATAGRRSGASAPCASWRRRIQI